MIQENGAEIPLQRSFGASPPHFAPPKEVKIPSQSVFLSGSLSIPADPQGIVLFAHGSSSSRNSPRNLEVAAHLNKNKIATLLFDLLTPSEAEDRRNVFDIPFLGRRLIDATKWVQKHDLNLPIGYFGASTGAGAALWAAAELGSQIDAVVSRGGRPDLAMKRLKQVEAPTLLIVGGDDDVVFSLNKKALGLLKHGALSTILRATHLFEEPGALEKVSRQAGEWFTRYFAFPDSFSQNADSRAS